ncbi:MAG TPA: hypothetical protein ACYCDB_01280 [Candidatus Azoamicus sp.]
MLKKKLVNNILNICLIVFFIYFTSNLLLASEKKRFVGQGIFKDYKCLTQYDPEVSDRVEIAGIFGKPNIAVLYDVNCYCYCYHERKGNIDKVVYLFFAFDDNNQLIEHSYLRLYDDDGKDYRYKKSPYLQLYIK